MEGWEQHWLMSGFDDNVQAQWHTNTSWFHVDTNRHLIQKSILLSIFLICCSSVSKLICAVDGASVDTRGWLAAGLLGREMSGISVYLRMLGQGWTRLLDGKKALEVFNLNFVQVGPQIFQKMWLDTKICGQEPVQLFLGISCSRPSVQVGVDTSYQLAPPLQVLHLGSTLQDSAPAEI